MSVRPPRCRTLLAALLLTGWLTGGEARADGPARLLYKAAMTHMAAGDFMRAAVGFDAAYSTDPQIILLWNAARAYHRAEAFIEARERYLACLEAAELSTERKELAALYLVEVEMALRERGITPPRLKPPPPPARTSAVVRPSPSKLADIAEKQDAKPRKTGPRQSVRFSTRPLTLPAKTVALAAGTGYGDLRTLPASFGLMAGVAFGLNDNFEIGALALPLQLHPSVIYDLPEFYALVRARRGGSYEIAISTAIKAGIAENSAWILSVGSQALVHATEWLRMETGSYMDFIFADPQMVNLRLPLDFHIQFTEQLFVTTKSGFVFPRFDSAALTLPLGLGVGYTFKSDNRPLCDLRAQFMLPRLLDLSMPGDVDAESFNVSLNARFFFYL